MNEFEEKVFHKSFPQSQNSAGDPGDNFDASEVVIHNPRAFGLLTRDEKAAVIFEMLMREGRGRAAEAAWCFGSYLPRLADEADCYVFAHSDEEDPRAIRMYSRCSRDHAWLLDLRRAARLRDLYVIDEEPRPGRHDLLIYAE